MFKRLRFPVAIILLCVRWYCKYGISYRDLAEMMQEHGVEVDPTTIMRWHYRYAPELEKRVRRFQKYGSTSWHVDETYIKVGGSIFSGLSTSMACSSTSCCCSVERHVQHTDSLAKR